MRVGLFIPCYIDQFYPQLDWHRLNCWNGTEWRLSSPKSKLAALNQWPTRNFSTQAKPLAERFVAVDSPRALADGDVVILHGEFGVAENAAVWVTNHNMSKRVLYFLCQHLILVVPGRAIVDHIHTA